MTEFTSCNKDLWPTKLNILLFGSLKKKFANLALTSHHPHSQIRIAFKSKDPLVPWEEMNLPTEMKVARRRSGLPVLEESSWRSFLMPAHWGPVLSCSFMSRRE